MDLPHRTFLISGGGSGLGAATAHRLVAAGASVVLADLDEEAGPATAAALGASARFVHTDVTHPGSVQQAIEATHAHFGGLHGAVSCAGVVLARRVLGKHGPHDLESFTRILQVNVIGTFNVARLAAAALAGNEPTPEGERGVLVHTASVAAFDGQIGQAAYAASKGAVVSMTLPLARDLARHGIRVTTIAPGLFDTPMMAALPEAARTSLAGQVPFPPRLGRPAEFAQLVQQLIENPMLNGEVIRLDGAVRMAPQ